MNYTLFFTGLSGSGKSTIADKIIEKYNFVLLDGDILRNNLCEDLNFSIKDRQENMRRLKHLCKLFNDNNKNVITTFIAPFESSREKTKEHLDKCFIIYIKCDISICEKRDVKGLYEKVRNGEIKNFTGIDSPYEEPINPDLILDTSTNNIDKCVSILSNFIDNIS